MDTETFITVRRTIQDRLENRRRQLLQEKEENHKPFSSSTLLPLATWAIGQLRNQATPGLWTGLLTAGAGWAFSKILPRSLQPNKPASWIMKLASLARF